MEVLKCYKKVPCARKPVILRHGYSTHRVITVRQCTEKAGEQIQKSAKLGCHRSLMDLIAAVLSSSYG